MRVKEILVTELFGTFNHRVPLNLEEQITIIHGPNGLGKTILLQMVQGLFSGRYSFIKVIPFRKFEIRFDDNSVVWVEKEITVEDIKEQLSIFDIPEVDFENRLKNESEISANLKLYYLAPNAIDHEEYQLLSKVNGKPSIPLSLLEDVIPSLVRINHRLWQDTTTGETYSFEEVAEKYQHILPGMKLPEPDWWTHIRESIDVHLIDVQRLIQFRVTDSRRRQPQMIRTVQEFSNELAETIQQKLREYATLSQRLDRTFPARLVDQLGKIELTETDIRKKLDQLETKREALMDAGLLSQDEEVDILPKANIASSTMEVLAVYAQDTERKLSIYDDLAKKIELFTNIINKRFSYTSKYLSISQENGFSLHAADGQTVPLSALSSGEQHEIVMIYQMLFRVKANSLILIDEPELSLHVGWQQQFLIDLKNITDLVSFDVLLATHSPQIIHDRWDLTVELKRVEDAKVH